jgi:hypothetical protein
MATKKKPMSKRAQKEEAERREIARQQRIFKLKPWEFDCLPIFTKGHRNPFPSTHEHHSLWARMAEVQKKLDARRAQRAAAKKSKPEEA